MEDETLGLEERVEGDWLREALARERCRERWLSSFSRLVRSICSNWTVSDFAHVSSKGSADEDDGGAGGALDGGPESAIMSTYVFRRRQMHPFCGLPPSRGTCVVNALPSVRERTAQTKKLPVSDEKRGHGFIKSAAWCKDPLLFLLRGTFARGEGWVLMTPRRVLGARD